MRPSPAAAGVPTTGGVDAAVTLSPEGHDPQSTVRVAIEGPLKRLLRWYFLAELGVYLTFGAVPTVLLPLQVEDLDPARKAANLAIVAGVGALAAVLTQPIAGLLSDRTRSRLGRRGPWLLAGALIGAASLLLLASAGNLISVLIAYTLVQLGFNVYQGPLSAILPDRVPRGVRGAFSAAAGMGILLGILGGTVIASVLSSIPFAAYTFLAVCAALAAVGFVKCNPDHANVDQPREPMTWGRWAQTFWINPVAHPDFAFGFIGRLLTMSGYYLVSSYQLYLLQDYIGFEDDAVKLVPVYSLVALVFTLISTVVGGRISDRIGRRKPVVIVAGVLIALSYVAPWVLPSATGFAIYAVCAGLGFGAFLAVDQALMSELLPSSDDMGRDLGILNIAVTLPAAIAPAAAGTIVTTIGYAALFPVGLLISLLGALAVVAIRSVR